jgi:hypothetical protein
MKVSVRYTPTPCAQWFPMALPKYTFTTADFLLHSLPLSMHGEHMKNYFQDWHYQLAIVTSFHIAHNFIQPCKQCEFSLNLKQDVQIFFLYSKYYETINLTFWYQSFTFKF